MKTLSWIIGVCPRVLTRAQRQENGFSPRALRTGVPNPQAVDLYQAVAC